MNHTNDTILEKQRTTHIPHRCDVLVAGAGIAGVSAAIAAARNGAKVILLE
ncbi:MAG: FAD-dependent oxidoreductase, partial [Peptococcaceae bacterium]|nr:FAD-dependent oxidoreductase [Peptococcaceae bacterium]